MNQILAIKYSQLTSQRTFDRMVFIMREVERLCKMDIEELHKIYVSVLPKIRHNQEVLMSFDGEQMLYEKLKENLDAI